jgi:hypothetical protein
MGHDVAILDADASLGALAGPAQKPPGLAVIAPADVPARIAAGAVLIDVSPSMDYRTAHISGARWSIRPRLHDLNLNGVPEILLAARDPEIAAAAALELAGPSISLVSGGPDEWRASGIDLTASPDEPSDAECIDYLFFVHDRHQGNLAAAQAYLDWETGLAAQLDSQERSLLRPELSLPDSAALK